jgi:predicted aconitase with swiveling domain
VAPEVVVAGPRGKRRGQTRRWRLALGVAFVLWTFVLAGLALAWVGFDRFASDLRASNGHVPQVVKRALTLGGATTSSPQVILVRSIDASGPGYGSVLVRSDPKRHALALLVIPPSSQAFGRGGAPSSSARPMATPAVVASLRALGVPVNHVVLINLVQFAPVVDAVGGVTIDNSAPVAYRGADGRLRYLPAGKVSLSGSQALAYLHPSVGDRGEAAAALLRAVTDKILHLSSPSALLRVEHTISASIATDLSPDQVTGLVSNRLDATQFAECHLPFRESLRAAGARLVIGRFMAGGASHVGQNGASNGSCSVRSLNPPFPVSIPGPIIGVVSTIAANASSVLLWSLGAVVVLWTTMLLILIASSRRLQLAGKRMGATASKIRAVTPPLGSRLANPAVGAARQSVPLAHRATMAVRAVRGVHASAGAPVRRSFAGPARLATRGGSALAAAASTLSRLVVYLRQVTSRARRALGGLPRWGGSGVAAAIRPSPWLSSRRHRTVTHLIDTTTPPPAPATSDTRRTKHPTAHAMARLTRHVRSALNIATIPSFRLPTGTLLKRYDARALVIPGAIVIIGVVVVAAAVLGL